MRKSKSKNNQNFLTEYWKSYSDMMAAMLLIFILLMSYSIANALMTYEEKQNELNAKQHLLDKQQTMLNEQRQKIQAQQKQIDAIIGVKAEIIKSLSQAFSQSNIKVDIDQKTGTIRLDSTILFDIDSDVLAPAGISFLRSFLPMYISVLFNEDFEQYISEIIVEGHTDNDGPFMYNLNLSQRRAFSVVSFWLNDMNHLVTPNKLPMLRKRLTANGKSFSNLIYDADGLVDKKKSRRVEIRFRLNDENTIDKLKELLAESLDENISLNQVDLPKQNINLMNYKFPVSQSVPDAVNTSYHVTKPKKHNVEKQNNKRKHKSWLVD